MFMTFYLFEINIKSPSKSNSEIPQNALLFGILCLNTVKNVIRGRMSHFRITEGRQPVT